MNPYALDRREKISSNGVSKSHRKKLAKLKLKGRRERRKADKKALRDEYEF